MSRRGYEAPNYTQAPNALLDEHLPDIDSLGELKVILVVVRATIGWHEDEQKLTVSQLEDLTGMSRPSVIEGTKRAITRGLIERRIEGENGAQEAYYALNVTSKDSLPLPVKDLNRDQASDLTGSSKESEPVSIEERNRKEKTLKPLTGNDEGNDDDRRWAKALEGVRSQVTESTFHIWIEPVELVERRGDVLLLQAPDHIATWVEERFTEIFERCAAIEFGPAIRVEVVESETRRARRGREDLGLDRQSPRRRRRAS